MLLTRGETWNGHRALYPWGDESAYNKETDGSRPPSKFICLKANYVMIYIYILHYNYSGVGMVVADAYLAPGHLQLSWFCRPVDAYKGCPKVMTVMMLDEVIQVKMLSIKVDHVVLMHLFYFRWTSYRTKSWYVFLYVSLNMLLYIQSLMVNLRRINAQVTHTVMILFLSLSGDKTSSVPRKKKLFQWHTYASPS